MPYLVDADYNKQITSDNLSQIISADTTIRTDAERAAEAEITSYLSHRYKISTEFAKSGTDRNPQIVLYYIDIVLYHLHSRINPRNIPTLRMDRYDSAISWLKMAAKGDITAALDKIVPAQGQRIKYGSNTKLDQYW